MQKIYQMIQSISLTGVGFWLPLPLVGVLFWLGGSAVSRQVLHSSYSSPNHLQADTQLEMKLSVAVVVINVEINSRRNTTAVSIKTTHSHLKKLEYEFSATDPKQIEREIAQEIGLPIQEVRKLVRYRIVN
jgi:hypothetical protein